MDHAKNQISRCIKLSGPWRNNVAILFVIMVLLHRFAVEFDYDHHVISVRDGCYLTKESKGWHIPGKQYKMFCVEEPFDTTRNLGNSSDMASSKGLKEEFRRALDILHQKVSLNLVCAQWVFPPSYYHTNNNTRKNSNGTVAANNNNNNYAAGRRYANGYRSHNYAYDDRDYDDDDEDEEETVPEVSVMETLNIGTRPSTSKEPNGRVGNSSSSRQNGGESPSNKNSQAKDSGSSGNRSQTRAKQSKTDKENAGGEGSRSGSNRNPSKQDSGSTSSPKGRQKSSGRGDGQKSGRGNNSSNGGRAPRAAVEFSLADIANVVPKLMSAAAKSEQDQTQKGNGSNSQAGSGEDGSSSKNKRKGGKKNVYVLSTNSNRGDSSRRQPASKAEAADDQEKVNKVIFVEASEEDQSEASAPPA